MPIVELTYGSIESDLSILCGTMCFHVHRETLMRASPVWNTMLRNHFNDKKSNTMLFNDDDPASIKFIFDILYDTNPTNNSMTEYQKDNLFNVIDKYSLNCGLRFKDLLQSEHINQLFHGRTFCCEDRPSLGDTVHLEGDSNIKGSVTAIDHNDDTLSVQWSDGVIQSNVRYRITSLKPVSLRNVLLYALACSVIVIIGTRSRSH